MSPWLRVVEAYLVQALLRTPAFHRGVEKVARGVHRIRHGTPLDELGGTKIDQPRDSGLLQHFVEEVKTQLGAAETKQRGGVNIDSRVMDPVMKKNVQSRTGEGVKRPSRAVVEEEETAEAVWRDFSKRAAAEAPKQGILGEYAAALKEQLRTKKEPR